MTSIPDVNGSHEYDKLLHLKSLSLWSLDRQSVHGEDRRDYEAALASFQTALRSQHISGDGRLAATRRSRKVERHLKDLVKASRRAEQAAERLRTTYAAHVAHVEALPAQRAAKQQAKALKKSSGGGRRAALGRAAEASLHKSAQSAQAASPEDEAPGAGAGPRGLDALWAQQKKGA